MSNVPTLSKKLLWPILAAVAACCVGLPPATAQDFPAFGAPTVGIAPRPAASLSSGLTSVNGRSDVSARLYEALRRAEQGASGSTLWERRLAVIQGSYYLATGIWPILHMRSFEKVTGPKRDKWLVRTVGALVGVIGGTLLATGLDDGPSEDLQWLAMGSAAALTAVEVTYVAKGRISRIYLLDAAAELALIAGWALAMTR